VFEEAPGSFDFCPVCGWEDDHVQLRCPALAGGANRRSLWEEQQDLLRRLPLAVQVCDGFERDPAWQPLVPGELHPDSGPRSGLEYFHAAGEPDEPPYWQRRAPGE
jgi:hypothetical protein